MVPLALAWENNSRPEKTTPVKPCRCQYKCWMSELEKERGGYELRNGYFSRHQWITCLALKRYIHVEHEDLTTLTTENSNKGQSYTKCLIRNTLFQVLEEIWELLTSKAMVQFEIEVNCYHFGSFINWFSGPWFNGKTYQTATLFQVIEKIWELQTSVAFDLISW